MCGSKPVLVGKSPTYIILTRPRPRTNSVSPRTPSTRSRATAVIARASLPVLTRLDPELAHDLGLAGLRWLRPFWKALALPAALQVRCFGLEFAHPLGLAAGFDKNGDYLDALGAVGFSHVELGTVTPRPQPGNPKPRMFRIPEAHALINRMGFNNKGVDHLVAQLSRSRYRGIRGISIGKNADTPLENAQNDYLACLRKVYVLADYVAVNISSPNTARLRELQARDGLERILGVLLEERRVLQERHGKRVPLLVKVAPDLTPEQISALALDLRSLEVDGVIATNTSVDRSTLAKTPAAEQSGGLSGAPLHSLSVRVISQLRAELGANFPIIGVGGIVSADEALATLRAGANLIQIYTGFAYRGPMLLEEILSTLPA
jgi:dihydroorotate dehydrogenase